MDTSDIPSKARMLYSTINGSAVMINGKTHGRVDEARFNTLLDELRGSD